MPYTVLSPDVLGRMEPNLHYGLIAEEFDDTHAEFDYLVEALSHKNADGTEFDMIAPGTLSQPKQGRWELWTKTGTLVDTWSAKDPERIRRVYFHGALICEPGRMSFDAFRRVLGRVSQTGGWVTACGTFEGSVGWYPEYYELGRGPNVMQVQSFSMASWENLHAYPGGREDPEIKLLEAHYPPDVFLEAVGAKPAPVKGLVFRLFKVTLHVSETCLFNHDLDVWLTVDPGRANAYAVEACQFTTDDTLQVFDEIYETGLTDEMVIHLCQQRPWWKRVRGVVMDIAGKQKTVHHERSSAETWEHDTDLPVFTNAVGVQDGIQRVDTFLMPDPLSGHPHFVVHPRCMGVICEMGGGPAPKNVPEAGPWVYPTDPDGKVKADRPNDTNNHGTKALGYLLVHKYGLARPRKTEALKPTQAYGPWRRPHGTT